MRIRLRFPIFVAIGLAVALALALFVSPHASTQPDGLNKVAADKGFVDNETPQPLADMPTAGYSVRGVDDSGLGTALAGFLGVTVTFAVAAGLFLLVRRTRRDTSGRA